MQFPIHGDHHMLFLARPCSLDSLIDQAHVHLEPSVEVERIVDAERPVAQPHASGRRR